MIALKLVSGLLNFANIRHSAKTVHSAGAAYIQTSPSGRLEWRLESINAGNTSFVQSFVSTIIDDSFSMFP